MKKNILLCLMAIFSLTAFAQTEPNRLVVLEKTNSHKAFIVDRIDNIFFATVEGRVAADVTFKDYKTGPTGDTIWVAVTKTPECKSYKIACIPQSLSSKITTDEIAVSYFERTNQTMMQDDFTNAQMTGFDQPFNDNTPYTIITLGYDKYGVACSMSKAEFTTPKKPLVGTPKVTGEILNTTATTIKAKFTGNADAKGYAFCIFLKGEAQKQFEQFGPMMGLTNMGDMIKKWGVKCTGEYTYEWTGMQPNTDYEIYVQAWDVQETYADMVVVPVTTKKLGGTGVAKVNIEIKEFAKSGDSYYQRVIYTPNAECSLHRDIIIEKQAFDKSDMGEAGVIALLKEDHDKDPYWNQYGVDDATWNANPSTTYYACSLAKNINDEWGPLEKVEFTTPAAPAGSKVAPTRIAQGTSKGVTQIPFINAGKKQSEFRIIQK
ncbi:hypothetical protein [Prevotella falsenii]|uniref:hypothetical protein n=1 Tax=Prevotella falsenii TaxID=515414 RepID=UPI000468DC3A|nr:hypothetical protein [Prevotella falsenii]